MSFVRLVYLLLKAVLEKALLFLADACSEVVFLLLGVARDCSIVEVKTLAPVPVVAAKMLLLSSRGLVKTRNLLNL